MDGEADARTNDSSFFQSRLLVVIRILVAICCDCRFHAFELVPRDGHVNEWVMWADARKIVAHNDQILAQALIAAIKCERAYTVLCFLFQRYSK